MHDKYNKTVIACCISYVTQAIVVNFPPLLFVQFSRQYSISLSAISVLISVCFGVQLLVDTIAAKFDAKLNYRKVAILSQICAIVGIAGFALLPMLLPSPFIGLIIAELFSGIGGGLMEVIVSPIIDACPSEGKTARMSLLHSFYCWGQALTVLLTTVLFSLIGIERWWLIALLWTVMPVCSIILFTFVPIPQEDTEISAAIKVKAQDAGGSFGALLKRGEFYVFALIMVCAGASELAMSQWASSFAETGLKVSKAFGDVLGPCLFAVTMGLSRLLLARISKNHSALPFMVISSGLCILSYALAALSPQPIISLLGCALCGFSVGALWPGALSLSARRMSGSVALFALMALSGDIGALAGPAITGAVAQLFGGNLGAAFLFAAIFPVTLTVLLAVQLIKDKKGNKNEATRN